MVGREGGEVSGRRRSAADTREHVLAVAHDLFYWQGIRAIGVDRIAAEAGIAPTTLYRLFASKDDLIAAYVERAHAAYREWFTGALEAGGNDPKARVLALFDELMVQLEPDRCRGCPFLMVLTEFPDQTLPSHQQAVAMKQWVQDQFLDLASALEPADPATLAGHLTLLFEGAYATVQATGIGGPARQTRALAEAILPG
ncbi:transcriptional regulator, TetR family [Kribbella flavida DSM 17836]|uniref:Transcriptional regulator, TetR family n=1 Tax=Kribbella flavida (strain DSM 17836 / JCM 10339 / NBRC 14399) TaxID=479435 RepID=D2PWW7_KRIFD|nr:TetR/AcrR family transcriptional regulator [Kribbella flavida]ADB35347.1 transcriptional regulator, TetR family [Kribbella flavida DSM 17836]